METKEYKGVSGVLQVVREHPAQMIKAFAKGFLQETVKVCAIGFGTIVALNIVGIIADKIVNKSEQV